LLGLALDVRIQDDNLLRQVLGEDRVGPKALPVKTHGHGWSSWISLRFLGLLEDKVLDVLARAVQQDIEFAPDHIFGNVHTKRALLVSEDAIDFIRPRDVVGDAKIRPNLVWRHDHLPDQLFDVLIRL
jgi:hypothetical protein